MNPLPALHIDATGLTSLDAQVTLGGVDISNAVRRLELVMAPDEVNQVSIVLETDHVEVSAQALAMLTAQMARADEGACTCGPRNDDPGDPDPQCPRHAPEADGSWPR